MEKYIPGNLVGHGNRLWEVRHGKVRLRRVQVAQVLPMSCLCCLCRMRRANVVFIVLVSCCMHSNVDLTYINLPKGNYITHWRTIGVLSTFHNVHSSYRVNCTNLHVMDITQVLVSPSNTRTSSRHRAHNELQFADGVP
jgi:hypothetical protein